jgi:hypothetical protein
MGTVLIGQLLGTAAKNIISFPDIRDLEKVIFDNNF